MLAFPELIAPAATEAGIEVPPDLGNFDPEEYPHWTVFCNAQLGQPMPTPHAHWDNAKVIASISDEDIMNITVAQLIGKGLQVGFSKP